MEGLRLAADAIVEHEVAELGAGDGLRRVVIGEDADPAAAGVHRVDADDGANIEITLEHGDADVAARTGVVREGIGADVGGRGHAVQPQGQIDHVLEGVAGNDRRGALLQRHAVVPAVDQVVADGQAGDVGAGLGLQGEGVGGAGALQHRVGDGDVVGADMDRVDAAEGRRAVLDADAVDDDAGAVISKPPSMTDSAPRVPVPDTPWLAPRMVTALSTTTFSSYAPGRDHDGVAGGRRGDRRLDGGEAAIADQQDVGRPAPSMISMPERVSVPSAPPVVTTNWPAPMVTIEAVMAAVYSPCRCRCRRPRCRRRRRR